MSDVSKRARAIKLLVFDVDGVLTDGRLYFDDRGHESKVFDAKDGHGMVMLQHSGVRIAIITARTSEIVARRMAELRIEHVFQGRIDKKKALCGLMDELNLAAHEVAFMGDDVVDLPAMKMAGCAITVSDAHELVKRDAHWITSRRGGRGAAREVCDAIMTAQGTLEQVLQAHWNMA